MQQKGSMLIGVLVVGLIIAAGGAYALTQRVPVGTNALTSESDLPTPPAAIDAARDAVAAIENRNAEATADLTNAKDGAAMAGDMMKKDETDMMKKDVGDDMMKDEAASAPTTAVTPAAASAGTFEAYAPEKLALANDGRVVLFFHASWCPSCRALEADITANAATIPDDVHILKLDYDTETALKQKYGVARQHTLVEVDAAGNEIKTLTGLTNTLAQVVEQL